MAAVVAAIAAASAEDAQAQTLSPIPSPLPVFPLRLNPHATCTTREVGGEAGGQVKGVPMIPVINKKNMTCWMA
eukprot:8741845-Prorocentrum_lima.AAC.1